MKYLAVIFYVLAVICVGVGFHKIHVYENPDSEFAFADKAVNAYVGGDAYNYIINASYATGYFVLALVNVVIASTIVIALTLKTLHNKNLREIENLKKNAFVISNQQEQSL
jgi:DMSO reductase anchor subunit